MEDKKELSDAEKDDAYWAALGLDEGFAIGKNIPYIVRADEMDQFSGKKRSPEEIEKEKNIVRHFMEHLKCDEMMSRYVREVL